QVSLPVGVRFEDNLTGVATLGHVQRDFGGDDSGYAGDRKMVRRRRKFSPDTSGLSPSSPPSSPEFSHFKADWLPSDSGHREAADASRRYVTALHSGATMDPKSFLAPRPASCD